MSGRLKTSSEYRKGLNLLVIDQKRAKRGDKMDGRKLATSTHFVTVAILSIVFSMNCAPHPPFVNATAPITPPAEQFIRDYGGQIVDEHFLVLEIHGRSDKFRVIPASSSWGANYSGRLIDLLVIDLRSGNSNRVFNRPMAIEAWRGFIDGRQLKLDGHLIIQAFTKDTSGDGLLDQEDEKHLLAFDLASSELSDMAPVGYRYAESFPRDGKLVLTLVSRADFSSAVYEYDPADRGGRFIAKDIRVIKDD